MGVLTCFGGGHGGLWRVGGTGEIGGICGHGIGGGGTGMGLGVGLVVIIIIIVMVVIGGLLSLLVVGWWHFCCIC